MTVSPNEAMDHATRKMIVAFMMANKGSASFAVLRKVLGNIHPALVAHHCKVLVKVGYIEVRRYRKPRRSIFRLKTRGHLRGAAWVRDANERPPP